MSYKSILVNVGIDGPVEPIVGAAIDLAQRFGARLIGLCAADQPTPIGFPDAGLAAAEAWQRMHDDIEKRFGQVRETFDHLTADVVTTQWHVHLQNPTQALVEAARMADLVVTHAPAGAFRADSYRAADPASVVLRTGRPLLVIGDRVEHVAARTVSVAWKDGREARRAVADAIPFLAAAEEVSVVSVARRVDDELRRSLGDVVAYLAAHGIKARPELIERADENAALVDFMASARPDLVVSGAYGHSRLREWAFGGVTRFLLEEAGLNRFMSS